ncbi:DUF4153 domain-containing protein [Pedobacter sp. KR3-3]|uniref:DUF4153 domain-containing protein n=1 Tax=Pedobacter albus TaxID=3113905 RepID=A0ABU7I9K9_9SPHI|nr:DUF4153 domain-containing protein [Pedobacter sp. KR3-3]MEE1946169.1 DUF4153 domain-containing protein [Pedobacter sp. KR3-3]
MKLPSIQTLWRGAAGVFVRFPLQFLLAVSSTLIWCWLTELNYNENIPLTNALIKLLLLSNLALTLLLSGDLFAESQGYEKGGKWGLRLLALAICAALYLLLNPWKNAIDVYRVLQLAFAFHLLVAFAPFIGRASLNGFWQYNKTLFLRFLTSAFYAGVLFAGLAIALFAIDGLFNVDINYKWYMKLLAFVSAGFTTIFFLAGVPSDFDSLEKEQDYPKALKIFTQYVLIPLVTIYLAILLVYEIKIAIAWQLPKGLVSTLVLGYSVFGILSLLLVYPIRDREGNGWIRLFSRFFYLMIIPLVVLLILAIVKRVGNYGITESRYILIVLACWLSAITLYFLFSKKQNIKLIPISLCVLALLTVYGPQSAFSVAKYSQLARLKRLMHQQSKQALKERPEVVRYLIDQHGLSSLQSFTQADLKQIEEKIDKKLGNGMVYKYEIRREKIDTALALLKIKDIDFDDENVQLNFDSESNGEIVVKDYDVYFPSAFYSQYQQRSFAGAKFKFEYLSRNNADNAKDKYQLRLTINEQEPLVFDLRALAQKLYLKYKNDYNTDIDKKDIPWQEMQLTQQTKDFTVTLVLNNVNGTYQQSDKDFSWMEFQGGVLVKKR